MKTGWITLLGVLAGAGSLAGATLPTLEVMIDGSDVVLEWDASPLNPGSATPIYYGFQVENSADLAIWSAQGAPIAPRVGGGAVTHSQRVPLRVEGSGYFRLQLSLDLSGQSLAGADLSGVDFGGADLTGTDFSGADLRDADLSGAIIGGVVLNSLGGPPGAPVTEAIPLFPYDSSRAVYEVDGIFQSTDTLLVFPESNAATADINALIAAHGGTIVGGYGGDPQRGEEGMLVVNFPGLAAGTLDDIQEAFRESPDVSTAIRDRRLVTTALPDLTFAHQRWDDWSGNTQEGNWGMRRCRFPQVWNFNEFIDERIFQHGEQERFVDVGVIDDGYNRDHDELSPHTNVVSGALIEDHGTHVCGIIAASHDRGGVDGASPWVGLHVAGSRRNWTAGDTLRGTRAVGEMFSDLVTLIKREQRNVKVINVSMGTDWLEALRLHGTDITTDASRQAEVAMEGMKLHGIASRPGAPILVNAAGNWSLPSIWNTSISYAALGLNHPHIFVVEALRGTPNGVPSLVTSWPPPYDQTVGSNTGGNISAPGYGVLSCVANGYDEWPGTSMAAPHVTGLIAFLYALQPDLNKDEVMDLVRLGSVAVPGASNRIDAFNSAMEINNIRDGKPVLHALLDIDDRTPDGNQRIRMLANTDPEADPTTFESQPFDEPDYGKIGDGRIDMSDFRRFRDWNLLVAEELGDLAADDGLDGPRNHPKNDPNRNQQPYDLDKFDGYYPRTDFNGDGLAYGGTRTAAVRGMNDPNPLTDLEVMAELFDDPETGFAGNDLPFLLDSSDLHISLYWFMDWNEGVEERFEIHQVRIRIESRGTRTTLVYWIDVPEGAPRRDAQFIITLPAPDDHRVYVCGDGGEFFGELGENTLVNFDSKFGRDKWFAPRVLLDVEVCEPDEE